MRLELPTFVFQVFTYRAWLWRIWIKPQSKKKQTRLHSNLSMYIKYCSTNHKSHHCPYKISIHDKKKKEKNCLELQRANKIRFIYGNQRHKCMFFSILNSFNKIKLFSIFSIYELNRVLINTCWISIEWWSIKKSAKVHLILLSKLVGRLHEMKNNPDLRLHTIYFHFLPPTALQMLAGWFRFYCFPLLQGGLVVVVCCLAISC